MKVVEPLKGYGDVAEHLGAGHGLDELVEVDSESGSDTGEGDEQAPSWAEIDLD